MKRYIFRIVLIIYRIHFTDTNNNVSSKCLMAHYIIKAGKSKRKHYDKFSDVTLTNEWKIDEDYSV